MQNFLFCILQPSFPNFRNRPQALTCFHTNVFVFRNLLGSWIFLFLVAIALRLLPVFTQKRRSCGRNQKPNRKSQSPSSSYLFSHGFITVVGSEKNRIPFKVAIALKLLPVFTQLLFLMQKTCAFLNPKILTSLSNPF